jgi:hypothetical protein
MASPGGNREVSPNDVRGLRPETALGIHLSVSTVLGPSKRQGAMQIMKDRHDLLR